MPQVQVEAEEKEARLLEAEEKEARLLPAEVEAEVEVEDQEVQPLHLLQTTYL